MHTHYKKFATIPRMELLYNAYKKLNSEKKKLYIARAKLFLQDIKNKGQCMLHSLLVITFFVLVYMTIIFCLAVYKKDNSIVDVAWGFGFVLIALVALLHDGKTIGSNQILATGCVTLWALRLSGRIFLRNTGKGEDPRYKKWRKDWGEHVLVKSFFYIFMLQAIIMLLVAAPVLVINLGVGYDLSWYSYIGAIIFAFGLWYEALADYQLDRFMAKIENKGKILQTGLWKNTRHPNYFGEAVLWWGIWIQSLTQELGFFAIIGPALITFLLRYVSGVPLTEKAFEGNNEFLEYAKKTSPFIPWFVKNK